MGSPIKPGIMLKYEYLVEYSPLPPFELGSERVTTLGMSTDPGQSEWTLYTPRVKQVQQAANLIYELQYHKSDHPESEGYNETDWGTATIKIGLDGDSVECHWTPVRKPDLKFPIVGEVVREAERTRTHSRPVIRNQQFIRQVLLKVDKGCAITGELTEGALECAHISSVEAGGSEVYANCILLRADLHRLLDDGWFRISTTGDIVDLHSDLSTLYKQLLNGRNLKKGFAPRSKNFGL